MKELSKFFTVAALATAIVACNSTGGASGVNAKKVAWGPQKVASNAICERLDDSSAITITADKLDLTENKDHGCYGSDNSFCNLRIYQVMVESFRHGNGGAAGHGNAWGPSSHHGNIRGIIDSLDYIKSTGANAIWLTPIFATERLDAQDQTYDYLDGTGYFTSNYFKIDPLFGSLADAKELVKKAHSKGMYVLLDGVFGHAKANVSTVSPKGNKLVLNRRCRDWDGYIDKMSLKLGTCFKTDESMDFLKEVATYWINELKIDGWRLDQAYQLAPEEWKEIRSAVSAASADRKNAYTLNGKKVQPLGFMVGEYWNENAQVIDRNGFKGGALPSVMNFPLRGTLLRVLATSGEIDKSSCAQPASSINAAMRKARGYSGDGITTMFLGNHDVPRFGDLLQRSGNAEDGVKSENYMKAHEEALSFVASNSGPVIIYYGEETGDELPSFAAKVNGGCDKEMRCEDHVSRTDGHVSSLTASEKSLQQTVGAIFNLRDSHPALARGTRTHIYSDNTVYMDLKSYGKDKVIYALNNSASDRTVTLSADALAKLGLAGCSFENLLTKQTVDVASLALPGISGSFFGVKCK